MWKHVLLLGIVHIGGQGGLGHWGRLGAPIFTLTVRKSSLPGLDFTSPCAGLAARRHPLREAAFYSWE